jgi:hypothetical protein
MVSTLVGEEEGTFVYAPDGAVMLARDRFGVLEGELVVEGDLDTQRFPQNYSYESRIRLIPPLDPDSARRSRAQMPSVQ